MGRPKNVMEVFRLLEKTNCRRCGEKTCLAFAGAVYQGRRSVADCPLLDPEIVARFALQARSSAAGSTEQALFNDLKEQVAGLDFADAAQRTAGAYEKNRLTVKILGKDFSIAKDATLHSDLHMLPWVIGPFLHYVLNCRGVPLTGEWVSFRELEGGAERYPLFQKRIEAAMQQLADRYTDFFRDMVELFQARQIVSPFDSDICVVLPVLPLVPVMICYWQPDEGIGSDLIIFFDRSTDANIGVDQAYTLTAGLTQMFEKLAQRHGVAGDG